MVNCGLRAAFVWLCKPQTIEDHVLYHAAVVSRCTRQCAYPQQQSFAMCRGRAPDERTQKLKTKTKKDNPRVQAWMTTTVVVVVVVVSHIQRIGCQPEKNYFTRWPIPLVVC